MNFSSIESACTKELGHYFITFMLLLEFSITDSACTNALGHYSSPFHFAIITITSLDTSSLTHALRVTNSPLTYLQASTAMSTRDFFL